MSESLHDQICCCCPKRVVISGTYKVIGSTTIDKFKAYAHGEITENVTRACNKCYKKYTKKPKTKVMQTDAQITCTTLHSPHVHARNQCMKTWATVCNSCLYSSCIHHVQKHDQLQTLADAALKSQSDQDTKHKYVDKVCWF